MVSQAWTLSSRFCFSYLICVLFLVFFNSITCIIRFIPLIHRWKDGVIVSRRRRRQAVVWIVDVVVSFTNVLQRHFSQNPLAAAAQFPPQALSFCLASHFMLDPLLFCFILRYDDRVCLKGSSYRPPLCALALFISLETLLFCCGFSVSLVLIVDSRLIISCVEFSCQVT